MKIKWKVADVPSGLYRSFQTRDWPEACWDNEYQSPAAMLYCKDEYVPATAKSGQHSELTIYIADYSVKPWKWRRFKKPANTLTEAKDRVAAFLKNYPEYFLKIEE